jgi:hypothetical protein
VSTACLLLLKRQGLDFLMPSDLAHFQNHLEEYISQNPNTTEQWRSNKTANIDNSKNNDHEWTKDGCSHGAIDFLWSSSIM